MVSNLQTMRDHRVLSRTCNVVMVLPVIIVRRVAFVPVIYVIYGMCDLREAVLSTPWAEFNRAIWVTERSKLTFFECSIISSAHFILCWAGLGFRWHGSLERVCNTVVHRQNHHRSLYERMARLFLYTYSARSKGDLTMHAGSMSCNRFVL